MWEVEVANAAEPVVVANVPEAESNAAELATEQMRAEELEAAVVVECMHHPLEDLGTTVATTEAVVSSTGHQQIVRLPFLIRIREAFGRESIVARAGTIMLSAIAA